MKAIDRLYKFLDFKGVKATSFAIEIGVSRAYLSSQKKRGSDICEGIINKISDKCSDLNIEWLVTGKGKMLKVNNSHSNDSNPIVLQKKVNNSIQLPFISAISLRNFNENGVVINEQSVKSHYVTPKFEQEIIDFLIEIKGDEMTPRYKNGDVIACKIINKNSFIQWNKVHLIETKSQGLIIKRIMPTDNKDIVLMVSDNKDYPPFEMPREEILGLALVVGVIGLE